MKKFLCLLVGVAVLAVAAVPAAIGQSSSKVTPDAVTRKTKPTKAAHTYPWEIRTLGTVKKPRTNCPPGEGVKNNPYCTGPVRQARQGAVAP